MGSLVFLIGVPPSELLPESRSDGASGDDERNLERQLLDGLGSLLRVRIRIRRQPQTGAPMVFPVNITTKRSTNPQPLRNIWSIPDHTAQGIEKDVSINKLITDNDQISHLTNLLSRLAGRTGLDASEKLDGGGWTRIRRSLPETKLGSRVFLEVEDSGCKPSGKASSSSLSILTSSFQKHQRSPS